MIDRPGKSRGGTSARLRLAAASVEVALVLAATIGCAITPSTTSDTDWHHSAVKALEGVDSQIATALIVLKQEDDRRFVGPTAEVMLSQASSAAASVATTFAAIQPPPRLIERHLSLAAALDRGVRELDRVRIAVTAGERDLYDRLRRSLMDEDRSLGDARNAMEEERR